MLLKEHKDLKAAIIGIPVKEKDKLLLRLIAKDKILTEHLHFKLLEDESDLENRHQLLKQEIEDAIDLTRGQKTSSKDMLTLIRKLNGRINHHYKVTKAATSEVELRVFLLDQAPLEFNENVFSSLYKFQEKLATYFLRTVLSVLNKYDKLHEDLQFDLKGDLNSILNKIFTGKMAHTAKELGLPKQL